MEETAQAYLRDTGYQLFVPPAPTLLTKPLDSTVTKSFRKNILDNKSWPEPPEGGWLLPDNWLSKVNDLIRTSFTVKYLDGVTWVVDAIEKLCGNHDLKCRKFLEAREEGYYAAHVYCRIPVELPKRTWDVERLEISVELQVTTQLQEVIKQLLHKYYAEKRTSNRKTDSPKWQWDYRSDEFAIGYLGHILHYVEGMVMEIRDKNRGS